MKRFELLADLAELELNYLVIKEKTRLGMYGDDDDNKLLGNFNEWVVDECKAVEKFTPVELAEKAANSNVELTDSVLEAIKFVDDVMPGFCSIFTKRYEYAISQKFIAQSPESRPVEAVS